MRTILFVCTGNSCRSVMAAELFKKMLGEDNANLQALSAGVGAIAGMKPTEHTISLLQKEGIDASGHRSTPLLKAALASADLIFVMEGFQKDKILEIAPEAKDKVFLLREFNSGPKEAAEPEIKDPIGKPLEVYERSFELIKEGLENLMRWLRENGWI